MRVCPSCKAGVARNAQACPQCGHRFTTLLAKLFFVFIGLPILLAVAAGLFFSTTK